MRLRILPIIIMYILLLSNLHAQLSPGDLTRAHADLEGIRNCTQCHILGGKVSDDKCLECHKEIKSSINQRTGFHSSKEVKGKECATCHSEHHGRKFDMVRFDEDNFDHDLTGYQLTGAHKIIDCRECHIPDFIDDPELKKRKNTFLGMNQDCISCHEDVHQNTLSTNDCVSCHTTDAFSPADNFNHDKTNYALIGKHKEIECIDCHQKETRNGKEFQHFADLEFTNCISCHEDVHKNKLGTNCKQCHSEQSFMALSRIKRFNHNQTKFRLKGAHKKIDCKECHNMKASPLTVFQDQLGIRTNNCIECHEDVHDNKFGKNCVECHNEKSFQKVSMDFFDHNKTNFQLLGKHAVVDCRECHTESLTAPLSHNECVDCHTDYHEGQFIVNGISPDCAKCHTENGFENALFTIEDHNESNFPLEGAHLATPCFACHLQEEKWTFREIGERCVDCHEDVHVGFINEKYYPNQDCKKCHISANWQENLFDHNLTEFELSGVHAKQNCMACHGMEDKNYENKYDGFVDLSADCYSCHEDVHDRQFEQLGVTDCTRCHEFETWDMNNFNHDKTAFKLEGKHITVACNDCHKPINLNGKIFTQYKFNSFECVVCHQ